MPTLKHHINVFFTDADKAFIADLPDLKFCSARGRTPEDALRQVLTTFPSVPSAPLW